ncbi:MAG: cation:proton antiporter [Actinomycetota bacterium]|nr:cation:proton antiporter [Actinomycetota bacterium]MDD5665756.1 cation:proton antiporter [Actinomycetota bacterium]
MLEDLIPHNGDMVLLITGLSLFLGWGIGRLAQKVKIPQVVGHILLGVVLGGSVLGVLNGETLDSLVFINLLALGFIGFDIGGELSLRGLRKLGRPILWISILESLGAFILVTVAIFIYTRKLYLALIFGALSTATAPAATVDVLREYQASGPLTTTLFAVVGIDDGLAIAIYSFAALFAKILLAGAETINYAKVILLPFAEILGALALGFVVGLLLLLLVRKITSRATILIFVIGTILVTTGLANLLNFSLILANMAAGMTVINLPRYGRPDLFEVARGITPPLFIIFFVLVGARLDVTKLASLGVIGLLYVVFRTIGKQSGTFVGAHIGKAPSAVSRYLGFCLFSQAGVAIGLSIETMLEFGASQFGSAGAELGVMVITVIAATTLIFQLIGPPCTRFAVIKAGEAQVSKVKKEE